MNQVKAIRLRLGLSQQSMGQELGCTQSNVGNYERGQTLRPEVAQKLIQIACVRGLVISFDHIYGLLPIPELAQPAAAAD